jgi:3-oxoadipate enol-lactonase
VLWDRQFGAFARRHRVIRYDARGFGRSARPDMEFAFYEDLRAVLDATGVERASLVGLSLGGRTLLDFALAYPERVASLVPVNPGISGYDFSALEPYFAEIEAAVGGDDLSRFVEVQLRMWVDGPFRTPHEVDPAVRREVQEILTKQAQQNRARATSARVRELGAVARLAEIRAPTLIVESALDVPDIHAICALLERGIVGARRVVIDGAAHLVNLEQPRALAAAILPFLASVPW